MPISCRRDVLDASPRLRLSLQAPEIADNASNSCVSLSGLRRLAIVFDAAYAATVLEKDNVQARLAISAGKLSHVGSGERRILRPFLMLSKGRLTDFMSREWVRVARGSPRLHSTCGCQRPSNKLFL